MSLIFLYNEYEHFNQEVRVFNKIFQCKLLVSTTKSITCKVVLKDSRTVLKFPYIIIYFPIIKIK